MLNAAGHHRQGDVKGVQAIAKARGQVEHRTVRHQINGFIAHPVSVDIGHDLFMTELAQVLAINLFRHVTHVENKHPIFGLIQRLAVNDFFAAGRRGHHVRRGDSLL